MAFTGKGFTGTVSDVEYAKTLDALANHGVVAGYNGLNMKCTKVAGSRTLRVDVDATLGVGQVYAPGVFATLTTPTNATAAPTSPTNNRIDICVARFTWATSTVALVMKEGTSAATPVAPTLQQDPGVVFEVPLGSGQLASGDGEYINTGPIPIVDRRYWLEGGKFVQPDDGRPQPNARAGAVLVHPDTGEWLVKTSGSTWTTFLSHQDTGWDSLGVNISGFSADAIYGRTVNGITTLVISTSKTGANVEGASISGTLPDFRPDRFTGTRLSVSSPPGSARMVIAASGAYTIDQLTANAGASVTGSISFPES